MRRQNQVFVRQAKLRAPQQDVLGIQPGRDSVEPTALREVANWLLGLAKLLHGLRTDLDIAHQVDLADFVDAHVLNDLVTLFDAQHAAGLAHPQSLRIQIQAAGDPRAAPRVGACRCAAASWAVGAWGRTSQVAQLTRASRIAAAMSHPACRCRPASSLDTSASRPAEGESRRRRGFPRPGDCALGLGDRLFVKDDAHALPGLLVEDDAFLASVAVSPQHQGLHGELDAVCRPSLDAVFAGHGASVLVVDGRRQSVGKFRQVELGDHPMLLRRKRHRANDNRLFGRLIRLRRRTAFLVDALVLRRAFGRVLVVNEHALDLLEVEQPRAVDVLVDPPRRR